MKKIGKSNPPILKSQYKKFFQLKNPKEKTYNKFIFKYIHNNINLLGNYMCAIYVYIFL